MKGFMAFTRKEIMDYTRTYKLMILLMVFLFFGFLNPIIAKLTPEMLKAFMPEGIMISLPEPTVFDCWTQFFKNVTQMGIILVVIMFSGIMANELIKGTLINMLTKGLKRKTVILSKFTASVIVWTICYYTSFVVTSLYSKLFWEETQVANLFFSVTCAWIFGLLLIVFLILGGVIFRNNYGGLLFTVIIVAIMFILNIMEPIAKFNPLQLVTVNMSLLTKEIDVSELYYSVGSSVFLMIMFLMISVIVFNKKQI
ncbi:ABC transporter permease [Vallitalea longa]|uniref:ABC transporter permease n=1 Tax=Vallitalea longa TaxID=2936439 RepID=A0A9W5Y738_9FIRM|nr:ABC transporter permease [Vallitalea longa]GKX27652.1 ABC transporter permease [Vallitalea longa]